MVMKMKGVEFIDTIVKSGFSTISEYRNDFGIKQVVIAIKVSVRLKAILGRKWWTSRDSEWLISESEKIRMVEPKRTND